MAWRGLYCIFVVHNLLLINKKYSHDTYQGRWETVFLKDLSNINVGFFLVKDVKNEQIKG